MDGWIEGGRAAQEWSVRTRSGPQSAISAVQLGPCNAHAEIGNSFVSLIPGPTNAHLAKHTIFHHLPYVVKTGVRSRVRTIHSCAAWFDCE